MESNDSGHLLAEQERRRLQLRILDEPIVVEAPAQLLAPIERAYRRFRTDDADGAPEIRLVTGSEPSIVVDGKVHPLAVDLDPTLQLYQHFLNCSFQRVADHAILHSAAVADPGGEAMLLAGYSGHGKTSLTLEMLRRGWSFLSDDYAPLHLERGEVSPFPRTVALLPSGGAPIPTSFRAAVADETAPRFFGKVLIDVGRLLGEQVMADGPRPLAHVVVLDSTVGDRPRAEVTLLDLAVRVDAVERLEIVLGRTAGVRIDSRREMGDVSVLRLGLDPHAQPVRHLDPLLDDPAVLFCQKYPQQRPDFDAEPRAERIRRSEAAEFLGREILNRRRGSRLLARHQGSLASLFVGLSAALGNARCWRVAVGRFEQTAELIEHAARNEI